MGDLSSEEEGHYGKDWKFTPGYRDEGGEMVIEISRPIAEVVCDLATNKSTPVIWSRPWR
jgi:hypothetical protein